jgi:hypothetical protein
MSITILQDPGFGHRLFWSSTTSIVSVYSAWHNDLIFGFFRSLMVMCTSLIYWYYPIDGYRRKIDMICANGGIGFQLIYTAAELPLIPRVIYTGTVFACMGCYINARYYGRRKIPDFDISTRWHMLIHLFGNIGNLILYDGLGKNYMGW